MEEKTTTEEEVVETPVETPEETEEDISGVEGYDYEEDLEYDEEGNVIIPGDGEEAEDEEKAEEEPKAPEVDPRDAEIERLKAQLDNATKRLQKLDGQAKATMKDFGYESDDAIDALTKASAESRGVEHDAYKKERAEEEQRAELEREIRLAEGEKMMAEDLAEIKQKIPYAAKYKSPIEFPNFREFGRLRDEGDSPVDAFVKAHSKEVASLLSTQHQVSSDSKGHMTSAVPKGARDTSTTIPKGELEMYREMFPKASDKELTALYKRATKN